MAVGMWLRQSSEFGAAVAVTEREARPDLPLVFLYKGSTFERQLRKESRRAVAIVAVAVLVGIGLFAADRAGQIDTGDLLRTILGPFYDRFLRLSWFGAAALVLGGIGWLAKVLDGGDDYGLEIHHDGVVWMRRPAERYPVPWSNISRVWRLPVVGVDAFELVEPLQVSVGPGRWKRLDGIPFGHYEPDWRDGSIGAVLARYAPHLVDLAARPVTWPEEAADEREESFAGFDQAPRLPFTIRFHDTAAYREAVASGRFVNGVVIGLALVLVSLVAGQFLGVVDSGVYGRALGSIVDLPDLVRVGVFTLIGIIGLVLAFIVYVWICTTIAGVRYTDDWGIEFREEGFAFLAGESDRALVPWTDVRRIERVPMVDYDQFVLVRPFTLPAKFGPPLRYPEIGFGQLDPHWRRGPTGAVLRRHAPHLFADGPDLDDQADAPPDPGELSPTRVIAR